MPKLESVIEAQQFDRETLEAVFRVTREMEINRDPELLKRKIMMSFFYEPSTRTRFSFESAMKRLGGEVLSTENANEFSSKAKGESLEDSIRVVSGYCDAIVLRYYKEGGAKRAQNYSCVPVINAGDGTGQHPTQALLDLYTIKKIFGEIHSLKIAMVGDLINGRTVRSLSYFLAKHFSDNELYFISPSRVRMRPDIKEYLDRYQMKWNELDSFDGILPELDVVYQTRVQKERFDKDPAVYEEIIQESENLVINREKVDLMKKSAIIMHPLPRQNEIRFSVDKDPRARYFEQAQNGVYVRMALLKMILIGY